MKYIWIRNWEKFQHYRDRSPTWIKVYTELLSSDAYRGLTFHQRGALHGLWLAFASAHRQLAVSTVSLSRRLNGRISSVQLKALSDAGFIEIIDSDVLAQRLQSASLEKRREEGSISTVNEDPSSLRTLEGGGGLAAVGPPPPNEKKAKVMASLKAFVQSYWDEYPDKDVLVDELMDRACRRDEAEDLVARERSRRSGGVAA